MGVSYIVTVSDIIPFGGKGNRLEYRFPSRRKAFKFMDDAMSRGYYVTACAIQVPNVWDEMEDR